MTRCFGICKTGKRCSKKTENIYCKIHEKVVCVSCCEESTFHKQIKLENCGHIFCKNCLIKDFYDYQWFDGFSTNHPIKCPECDHDVTDEEFSFITDYLSKKGVITRKILYKIWLCPAQMKTYHQLITIGKDYHFEDLLDLYWKLEQGTTFNESDILKLINTNYVETVYFPKCNQYDYFPQSYTFEYCSKETKSLMPELQKELVEYVFHPSRIKTIERLDEI